ncbi:hypothetical protein BK138_34520 [Paenibacillus rhizosphaerae]|uniref:HTH-like domain-containing protein n=1 Tax=Paenibacillus rhizosphaerae TaxID=297318 RepID=A0A1R1DZ15_9BACL|nr:hypothetical protein BK138_34520 [Paenibacillus rhizosphaerae]
MNKDSKHKFRYGYWKIPALLQIKRKINHKRVHRIMQREGLQCRVKVKKRKLLDTLGQLPTLPGTMLHSDQGSVYTSQAYHEALLSYLA